MGRLARWITAAAVAALALCMAGVIFMGVQQMRVDIASAPAAAEVEEDEVSRFRLAREQLRAVEKAQLNDVAHDAEADEELAEMAKRALVELCAREEQELTLEGVLRMRGWGEPVVTVHADSVNVLLQTDVVTAAESAAILELVCRETGVKSGNVKIMPVS